MEGASFELYTPRTSNVGGQEWQARRCTSTCGKDDRRRRSDYEWTVSTYIPVETEDEIKTLKAASPFLGLSDFSPRLQLYFPKDAEKPTVHWIVEAHIFEQNEGPEKRSVGLTLLDNGSVEMHTYDDGETALKMWGKEDYEFWTTIPPNAVALLAFESLRERFVGRENATNELRDFCKENSIDYKWDCYPP